MALRSPSQEVTSEDLEVLADYLYEIMDSLKDFMAAMRDHVPESVVNTIDCLDERLGHASRDYIEEFNKHHG